VGKRGSGEAGGAGGYIPGELAARTREAGAGGSLAVAVVAEHCGSGGADQDTRGAGKGGGWTEHCFFGDDDGWCFWRRWWWWGWMQVYEVVEVPPIT
jgi:hypothetical protein